MTRPEPTLPLDGTCAECGRRRGVGAKNKAAKVAAVIDPFCSTECAKRWFGTPEYSPEGRKARTYVTRVEWPARGK